METRVGMFDMLKVKDITKAFRYGEDSSIIKVLDSISFTAQKGEIISIVGPSGCGKSTLLSIIAGFEKADQGEILYSDITVQKPDPKRAVVFQTAELFPWLTVYENITFGLKIKGKSETLISKTNEKISKEISKEINGKSNAKSNIKISKHLNNKEIEDNIREKVNYFIKLVDLEGFENFYPDQISVGMQQRVAIARVLILNPKMLILDEPFSALDYQTRIMMQKLLLKLWQELKITLIFVTHDVEEAIFMADRTIVLSKRPAKIVDEIIIPFARPRDTSIIADEEFSKLKSTILEMLF